MKRMLSVCLALCLACSLAVPALGEALAPAALTGEAPAAGTPAVTGVADATVPEGPAAEIPAAGTVAEEKGKEQGTITIDNTYEETTLSNSCTGGCIHIVTGKGTGKIVIDGGTHTILLDNVTIDNSGHDNASAIDITDNAQVTLELTGENELTGASQKDEDGSANAPAIWVDDGASLTIRNADGQHGTLTARAGDGGNGTNAAGIGAGNQDAGKFGNITIESGTIYAYGAGQGSGIGSSDGTLGDDDDIVTITGGVVYADGDGKYSIGAHFNTENGNAIIALPDHQQMNIENQNGIFIISAGINSDAFVVDENGDVELHAAAHVYGTVELGFNLKTNYGLTVNNGATLNVPDNITLENANGSGEQSGITVYAGGVLEMRGTPEGDAKLTVEGGGKVQVPLTADMITLSENTYTYDGKAKEPTVTVSETLWQHKLNFTGDNDYTVAYSDNTNAGAATVTVTPKDGGNLLGTDVSKTFTIQKATALKAQGGTLEVKNRTAATYTFDLEQLLPENIDTSGIQYTADQDDNQQYIQSLAVAGDTLTVTVNDVESTTEGQVAVIKVTIETTNYTDMTAEITVKAVNPKEEPDPEPSDPGTPVVPDTSITLDKHTMTMAPGDVEKLYATVRPSGATYKVVEWTSSNPDVVAVNNAGVVMALADGEAVITATSWYGNTDTCAITVETPQPEEPTDPETPEDPDEPNEEIKDFVRRCYLIALDREPDAQGYADWTRWLADGTVDGKGCVYGFIFSREMADKNLSDADFIETLYWVLLDRPNDEDGKAFWVNYLAEGHTRLEVFLGFADSIEFIRLMDSYGVKHTADITFPGM